MVGNFTKLKEKKKLILDRQPLPKALSLVKAVFLVIIKAVKRKKIINIVIKCIIFLLQWKISKVLLKVKEINKHIVKIIKNKLLLNILILFVWFVVFVLLLFVCWFLFNIKKILKCTIGALSDYNIKLLEKGIENKTLP